MKIAIIGNAGSGKSTLALSLHKILCIPLYHLDQYFWKPNWQEPNREEFEKIHDELCDRDDWIIEGMSIRFIQYRIEKADIIIFLDVPTYVCLYRIFKRAFMHFGKEYFSSAKGCRERFPSLKFLKFVWNFNASKRSYILELLELYKSEKKIFIVKNRNDLENVVKKIEKDYCS